MNINSSETAIINEISGQHIDDKTDDDIMGFWAEDNQVHYFPKNLHKIFKNLELILISNSQLKEIKQKDLKNYPKLEFLCLDYNKIKVLENDLFNFNPNLLFISISYNNIQQIGPETFSHLKNLNFLWVISNSCIDMYAENNKKNVKKIIMSANHKCTSNYGILIVLILFIIFLVIGLIFCKFLKC